MNLAFALLIIATLTLSLVIGTAIALMFAGLVFLIVGVVTGIRVREPRLLLFILPNLVGLGLYQASEYMADHHSEQFGMTVVGIATGVQLLLVVVLRFWLRKTPVPTESLSLLSLCHALLQAIAGSMIVQHVG